MRTGPNYEENISVGRIIILQNTNNAKNEYYFKMLNHAAAKLYAHMGNTMDIHHNPPQSFGKEHYRKDFALTPEDIMVVYDLRREGSTRFEDAKNTKMDITLKSFKTPVAALKQELTDIIVSACDEMRT